MKVLVGVAAVEMEVILILMVVASDSKIAVGCNSKVLVVESGELMVLGVDMTSAVVEVGVNK